MALVKKSKIGPADAVPAATAAPVKTAPVQKATPRSGQATRDVVAERIGAATEELAAGLTEAAAATKELGRSMQQIAAGAEEAASASQEQSNAVQRIVEGLGAARSEADLSSRRTETLSVSLTETTTQISTSVRAIERAAQRQSDSVQLVTQLDRSAQDIGEITRVVSRIADQTNLLALNAAIEAARAGEEGRGFAVVADEVRNLAAVSDRNARAVQELTGVIQKDVVEIGATLKGAAHTAMQEARAAMHIVESFAARREDMTLIVQGNRDILTAAVEAERAAVEAQKGAEQVASAAEEQSSAATESQVAIEQQAKSLSQGQTAAQGLAELGQGLRSGKAGKGAAEQISASAEELSASVQQMSGAATQIMAAVEQINRAAQLQSAATHQSSAAMNQIENSARVAQKNSQLADDRIQGLQRALEDGKTSVENLITGVAGTLQQTQQSIAEMKRLEGVGRKIQKTVDDISLIAVQTSMLAVSGAVEAARAGETGRGFAVVSNDIRSLAREASENVDRAADTVRDVLEQIMSLRADLEQIHTAGSLEVQNNRALSASLEKIAGDISGLGASSRSIRQGADSILASTTEITKAARQIAAAAEEASAAAREAATAAAEQSSSVEDLAAAIEEIASLADELQQSA